MLKSQITAFFAGLLPLVAVAAYRLKRGANNWMEVLPIIAGILVLILVLYIITRDVLVKLPLFRKLFLSKYANLEGYWATDLKPKNRMGHPTCSYSLAKIEYDNDNDVLRYSGRAFLENGDSSGEWAADSLLFDKYSKKFLFSSFGHSPGKRGDKSSLTRMQESFRVQSFGLLKPAFDGGGDILEGNAVDLGNVSQTSPPEIHSAVINFEMKLYRVEDSDFIEVLGKKRQLKNEHESSKIARCVLERVGVKIKTDLMV